jgi:glutamate-1-semialdehyde 2,1-aminomutase
MTVKNSRAPNALESRLNPELYQQACNFMPGGVSTSLRSVLPHLVFRRAQGTTILDAEGNEYLDYHAAFGAVLLGHNYEPVNRRISKTMRDIDLLGMGTIELEIALARKLCQTIPSAERILLCNSGSEATYHSIRLARAVTGRKKIIIFQGCYHGWHDSVAMNVISPREKLGQQDLLSLGSLPGVVHHTLVCPFNDFDAVERTVKANKNDLAAIIREPIPHNIGCVLPSGLSSGA